MFSSLSYVDASHASLVLVHVNVSDTTFLKIVRYIADNFTVMRKQRNTSIIGEITLRESK